MAAGRERAELEAVLSSSIFRKAPNQSRLLRYLCERYFEHQSEQPKEHQIAIEALGRNDSFDERESSIVRVEAFRLRRRLQRYYETEGSGHPLRIALDPGQYRVRFIDNQECATEIFSELVPEPPPVADTPRRPPFRAWRLWVVLALITFAGAAAAGVIAVLVRRSTMTQTPP